MQKSVLRLAVLAFVVTFISIFLSIPLDSAIAQLVSRPNAVILDSIGEKEASYKKSLSKQGNPHSAVHGERVIVAGIPVWKTAINLNDPETIFVIAREDEVERAGGLPGFIRINRPAFVANGTFKDDNNRVWTMISEGGVLEGQESMSWSTGAVLGLRSGNQPEMMNRAEGVPWDEYWFALTSAPRLLSRSQFTSLTSSPELNQIPRQRSAIGFSSTTKTLYHVVTVEGEGEIYLEKLAEIMKEIGCDEAVNLEGGDGVISAVNGTIQVDDPGRNREPPRSPVIVVYDASYPPPDDGIRRAWQEFQALHGS